MNVDNVPHEQISHDAIRGAVYARDAARAAQEARRRDVIELEQTREQAEWGDAEAVEAARAAGKAEPKRRHVVEHDRKTEEAKHEAKVAQLAFDRARNALRAALEQHGDAWCQEVRETVESTKADWQHAVNEVIEVHGRYSAVLDVARKVLGPQPPVSRLFFPTAMIRDVEFASHHGQANGVIEAADVLAALAALGSPKPVREAPQPTAPTAFRDSPLMGHGSVRAEHEERVGFQERAAARRAQRGEQ
ncbi:MAG: hypothetical protein ACYCU0_03160 [Solirubrobacteraceae bacterium]